MAVCARPRSLTVMARVRDTPLPLSGVRQGAIALELPDELIERIAERVAEIIVEKPQRDAGAVARCRCDGPSPEDQRFAGVFALLHLPRLSTDKGR